MNYSNAILSTAEPSAVVRHGNGAGKRRSGAREQLANRWRWPGGHLASAIALWVGLLSLVPIAQAQSLLWARAMGGTLHDAADSIAVDAAGNVYSVGNFGDTVDFDPGAGAVLTGHIVNRIDRGHGEHISGEEDVLVEDVLYALGRNQHHDRENEIHQ